MKKRMLAMLLALCIVAALIPAAAAADTETNIIYVTNHGESIFTTVLNNPRPDGSRFMDLYYNNGSTKVQVPPSTVFTPSDRSFGRLTYEKERDSGEYMWCWQITNGPDDKSTLKDGDTGTMTCTIGGQKYTLALLIGELDQKPHLDNLGPIAFTYQGAEYFVGPAWNDSDHTDRIHPSEEWNIKEGDSAIWRIHIGFFTRDQYGFHPVDDALYQTFSNYLPDITLRMEAAGSSPQVAPQVTPGQTNDDTHLYYTMTAENVGVWEIIAEGTLPWNGQTYSFTSNGFVTFGIEPDNEDGPGTDNPAPSTPSTPAATTTTTANEDGSTTTTVTDNRTGTVTETTVAADGTTGTTVTDSDGSVTNVSAAVSEKAAADAAEIGEAVTLPLNVEAAENVETAVPIDVILPKADTSVTVEIPVEKANLGTVAILVHADGTEEIIKGTVLTEGGVAFPLEESSQVKIVDNTKTFGDVSDTAWSNDAITFATSREIFNGTGGNTFSPKSSMTRGMLMTVLARYDGADAYGRAWQEKGMDWSVAHEISDGSAPETDVTREQLVTMLWRYSGRPASSYDLRAFADADQVSSYAAEAAAWAVENGVMNGSGGKLLPGGNATREQVAQFLMNFINR